MTLSTLPTHDDMLCEILHFEPPSPYDPQDSATLADHRQAIPTSIHEQFDAAFVSFSGASTRSQTRRYHLRSRDSSALFVGDVAKSQYQYHGRLGRAASWPEIWTSSTVNRFGPRRHHAFLVRDVAEYYCDGRPRRATSCSDFVPTAPPAAEILR
ncbi:hypothetical protein GALMADRAFT_230561 [Galerina marginata CBS 339.88]|uniref:Uncharacterized protein n=1 Tax=Galerina marginata (strain CBS 339.88) TaxID=685588 RepID=A0A067SS26_GALM3|nr:hypothetical protein GALMADRAFT_230561 [Galerina marginata CBS 339.88]